MLVTFISGWVGLLASRKLNMSIALPPTISSPPPPTKHPTAATPLQPLPPPSSSSPSRQSQGFDAVLNPSASSRRLAEGVAPANAPAVPPTIVVPSPISPPPRPPPSPPPSLPPPPQTQRSSLAPSPHVYIAAPAPSFWPPPAGSSSSSSTGLAVGLSVGLSVVLLLLGILYYFYHKRKGRQIAQPAAASEKRSNLSCMQILCTSFLPSKITKTN